MPELPEVETVRKGLQEFLVGKRIAWVDVRVAKVFVGDVNDVIGKEWLRSARRGKLLVNYLSEGVMLLIHLRMTGQLIVKSRMGGRVLPDSHTRVVVGFEDGEELYFQDQRMFGFLEIAKQMQVASSKYQGDRNKIQVSSCKNIGKYFKVGSATKKFLENLGVEPLEEEFTLEYFKGELRKRGKSYVKGLLLDQTVVAGIGNIYADEASFRAGIDNERRVASLTMQEMEKLHEAIRYVLSRGVELRGASQVSYVDVSGERGRFLDVANVYGREGLACRMCGGMILKKRVVGRGTHWCGVCQK